MAWLFLLSLLQAREDLTHFGNQWGFSGTGEVFVPQLVMYAEPQYFYANPSKIDRDIQTFLHGHGFNGFHVFLSCRWFDLTEDDCRQVSGRDPPLDPRTFEALELLIEKTHEAGGIVHLWAWGDEERGQTPKARSDWGGLHGPVAQKVDREIARRLGPLPGWSLGYGFDLNEWVTARGIRRWRNRLQRLLPRFHFLGGRPGGPNQGTDHRAFREWNEGLDYASYEHHEPSYAVYVAALEANPDKPVLSEDRFRVMRDAHAKHYTPDDVRRGLWHSMMAGGVGNIWGYLLEGGSHELGSASFPNRAAIRTHFEFVRGRFQRGMKRCSPKDADPRRNTLCLGSRDTGRFLLYRERTAILELPPEARGPRFAVDTRQAYREIEVPAGLRSWDAPYESDWAVAIGSFDRRPRATDASPVEAPPRLRVASGSSSRVDLAWSDAGDGELRVERAEDLGGVPGSFRELAAVPASRTAFSDTGVVPATAYWYRLRRTTGDREVYSENLRVFVGRSHLILSDVRPASVEPAYLEAGDPYYVDRSYLLRSIPAPLEGGIWIRTRNDDKLAAGESHITFEATRPVTVWIGFDRRATRVPRWLERFRSFPESIEVDRDAMGRFELYRRDYEAGRIVLGGASAPPADWPGGRSHYVVVVVPR